MRTVLAALLLMACMPAAAQEAAATDPPASAPAIDSPASAAPPTSAAEVFSSPSVGFRVTKPAGWVYLSAQENLENLKRTEMADAQFQEAMVRAAQAPLVTIVRYPEPYNDLNPTFKVGVKALGAMKGEDPKSLAAAIVGPLQGAFHDFAVVEPPADVTVSGLRGARVRVTYTLMAGGAGFPTNSELVLVPRGDFLFMISLATRQDEANGKRAEVQAILDSVVIDP